MRSYTLCVYLRCTKLVMDVQFLLFFLLIINSSVVKRSVEAQESTRIVAIQGEPVELTCVTPSRQRAVWYREEVPIPLGDPDRTVTNNALIIQARPRYSGRYTCIDPAQTPTNLFSRDFSLVVEQRPEIIRPPAGLNTVAAGAKVTFGCISDGSPPPPIEWLFNDNVEITTLQPSVNGSTSFVDITAKLGLFEITCMIPPSMSTTNSKTVTLSVIDLPFNETVEEKSFTNVVVDNDSPTTFRCLVPPVMNITTIQWIQDGVPLSGENSNELTVNRSETGVYCCEVNGLIFRCAYIYRESRPSNNRISSSISTVSGRSISLYCVSEAQEPAEISWLYENGTKVINSSDTWIHDNTVGSSHLTLANVQAENQELEFICEAENSVGLNRRDVSITTVGSCNNNILTPPNSTTREWILPTPQNFIPADESGESVFQISYVDLMGRSEESITHTVRVNSSVEALHFRAQIRQIEDEMVFAVTPVPHVCLTVDSSTSQCATNMLNDQTDGWQWVEGMLNITALGISDDDLMRSTVKVELYADRTDASSPSSGEVFFDNICVEAVFKPITVVAPSEDDDSDDDNTIIIIGAAAGGAALLVVLLIVHILCCCVCCRKNKVKTVRFRKQSVDTIKRNATQRPDINVEATNAIHYPQASKQTDSTDYGYTYVMPNKIESNDENYDDPKGNKYVKQNNMISEYQSTSANGSDAENHNAELYDSINEPDQPQYEILPGEAGETAQYLTVVHDADDDKEEEEEMQYLDILPANEEEIYSDISDSVKQQALESSDQESEIYH